MKTKGVVVCLGVGAAIVAGALIFALSQNAATDPEPAPANGEIAVQEGYCQQLLDRQQTIISRQEVDNCYQSQEAPETKAFVLLNHCSGTTTDDPIEPVNHCPEWIRPYSGNPAPSQSVDDFCITYEFRVDDWCGDEAGYERYQQLKQEVGLNQAAQAANPGVLNHPQDVFARHKAAGHYPQSAVWYYFLPAD